MQVLRSGQGEGGYARKLTDEELAAQKVATDRAIADFDVVITTAQVPGAKPPQFISKAGIQGMKPGSVIIDLAASKLGGNVEGSDPTKAQIINGVKIIGAPSLASNAAKSASNLLARNISDVVLHFIEGEGAEAHIHIDTTDELSTMLVTKRPDLPVQTSVDVAQADVKAPADVVSDEPLETESARDAAKEEPAQPKKPAVKKSTTPKKTPAKPAKTTAVKTSTTKKKVEDK
jgi:NAD(P) transhydrogenase subunit alpha